MSKGIQVQKGGILFHRLGNLEFGPQERWTRAPESKGMWAFPWPYFETFLAFHKYRDALPKRLQTNRHGGPTRREWYLLEDTDTPLPPDYTFVASSEEEYFHALDPEGNRVELDVREDFWTEQEIWYREVGKRVVPLRKFWYEGPVYAHIAKDGTVGNPGTMNIEGYSTDWYLLHTSELAAAILKSRGDRTHIADVAKGWPTRTSRDHLEVFIPAHRGKIWSPRPQDR